MEKNIAPPPNLSLLTELFELLIQRLIFFFFFLCMSSIMAVNAKGSNTFKNPPRCLLTCFFCLQTIIPIC